MFKAFIFDFDGLILDTETPEFQSWDLVYKDVGLQLSLDEWKRYVGTHSQFDPYQPIRDFLGETFNKDEVRQKRRRHYNELMDQEKPLPGVIDLINTCTQENIQISVASSSSRDWVDGYLEKHGLTSHFIFRLCKDDVQNVKPNPELYLKSLERLRLSPSEVLTFEDSFNGLSAAKSAGLKCVVVPNKITKGMDFSKADLVVNSLEGIGLESLEELYK